jgi:hypothetical protein
VGDFVNSLNTNLLGGDNGSALRRSGFPENYIVPSPQYSSVNIAGNNTNSKYHAMHLQLTRRMSAGFTNTTTFIWSKSMANGADIDPSRRGIEKALQASDRKYQFTSNGAYELPFGPGKRLLGNAPSWLSRIVEQWQLAGIMNYNTGDPLSLESTVATIGTQDAKPNAVGMIPKDMGKVTKVANGVRYFEGYTQITDPGINTISSLNGLRNSYNNRAIAAPNGQIILVNPQPGELGTLGYTTLRGPSSIRFDANLVKRIRVGESKSFEFRIDAINVLNTPIWGNPENSINDTDFGLIDSATGSRRFILNARINF